MSQRYKLSFTAASLALPQSLTIAQVYLDTGDWSVTRTKVLDENLLQLRSRSSSVRVYRELQRRLAGMSTQELTLLTDGDDMDQKALLWYAFCRRYALVGDWARQVLVPRLQQMDLAIDESDVYAFFARQALDHPEIEDIKPSTREKLVTNLLRTMREAGILSSDHVIVPAVLSPQVVDVLTARGPGALGVFPLLSGPIGV